MAKGTQAMKALVWAGVVVGLLWVGESTRVDTFKPRVEVGHTYQVIWSYNDLTIRQELLVMDVVEKDGWVKAHNPGDATSWWVNLNQAKAFMDMAGRPAAPHAVEPPAERWVV